jgi:hypothetical protein
MKYFYGKYVQDGHLKENEGRIVIFEDAIMVAYSPSMDHNYLLRAMASRYRLDKELVIAKAIRLYYAHEGDRIVVSPVRKVDDELIQENWDYNRKLIKRNFR